MYILANLYVIFFALVIWIPFNSFSEETYENIIFAIGALASIFLALYIILRVALFSAIRRLRDIGWNPYFAVLIFFPYINLSLC